MRRRRLRNSSERNGRPYKAAVPRPASPVSEAGDGGDSPLDQSLDKPLDDPLEQLERQRAAPTRRRQALNTAVGLLARREHAQAEVRRKLRQRGYEDELAVEVVDELTRQRLLSDERFAEMFVRSRAERGQGPVRLRAELRQLQVPTELIERALHAAEDNGLDWRVLAGEVRLRRFGTRPAAPLPERAKQVRFLQYRGFTADQIRAALRHGVDQDMEVNCEDELLEGPGDTDEGADEYDPP